MKTHITPHQALVLRELKRGATLEYNEKSNYAHLTKENLIIHLKPYTIKSMIRKGLIKEKKNGYLAKSRTRRN